MDLAIDRTRLLRLVRKSRLSSVPSHLISDAMLTLFIIEDDSCLIVHDMTSPNEVHGRSDRCRSSPSIQYAQVCGTMVDGCISV
jgi:hypothetical protein